MIKHAFFAVTIGLIIFFLYLFQYTGAFKSVTLGADQRGPYTMIYKDHTGAYHKVVSTIEEVEKWAKANGLKCRLSFGEYFDDPKIVEEGRLKSRAGCLVDPLVAEENVQLEKLTLPEGMKKDIWPQTKAVVALFNGAPSIGPLKVYPKAYQMMAESNLIPKGPVLEVYEVLQNKSSMKTTYIWALEN